MAVSWQVIGFSGRPVEGSTGWKPVIVRDLDSGRLCVDGAFGRRPSWSDGEVVSARDDGLVTILPRPLPFREGWWLIYAHEGLVRSNVPGSPRLSSEEMEYSSSLKTFFWYVPREEALAIWRSWARTLVHWGIAQLASIGPLSSRAEAALDAALRARKCTVPKELHVHRKWAFILAYAAVKSLGKSTRPLEEDASLDFSDQQKDQIRRWALRIFGFKSRRMRIDLPGWLDTPPGSSFPRWLAA